MNRAKRVVAGAAALSAGVLAFWAWNRLDRPPAPPPSIGGFVLPEPRKLPAVELVDENGALFTPQQLAGRWSFLYFGYTYCPDVCPLALVELAAFKEILAVREIPGPAAAYYLVSVDPQRDTPESLRDYVHYFDPTFHGLTGSPDAISALAKAAEALFFIPAGQGPDNYLVSHSNNFALVNPAGELEAIFTPPHSPEQLAADFAVLVAYRSSREATTRGTRATRGRPQPCGAASCSPLRAQVVTERDGSRIGELAVDDSRPESHALDPAD
jgi:protein SCO1/2